MATRVITVLMDDLTGKEGEVETITFGLDGVSYEIDLSGANAKKLRSQMEPFIQAGRRVGGSKAKRNGVARRADLGAIREWANSQGMKVSDRGRIPAKVIAQYDAR